MGGKCASKAALLVLGEILPGKRILYTSWPGRCAYREKGGAP